MSNQYMKKRELEKYWRVTGKWKSGEIHMFVISSIKRRYHDYYLWCTDKLFPPTQPHNFHTSRWNTQRYFSLKWMNGGYWCFTSPRSESTEGRVIIGLGPLDHSTVKHDSYGHCTAAPNRSADELKEAHLQEQERAKFQIKKKRIKSK